MGEDKGKKGKGRECMVKVVGVVSLAGMRYLCRGTLAFVMKDDERCD